MEIFDTIAAAREFRGKRRALGERVALVPTMGNLHEGHLRLVDLALEKCEVVVVSIFVNPTQFGEGEDFEAYPRTTREDFSSCEKRGVAAVFAPSASEMYPERQSVWVVEDSLSLGLCGRSRPDHFRGVASVVAKLFNIIDPDVAVFGRKDAQQAAIVAKMVRDLNFPVELVLAPIVREADGLAMSSRNRYLDPASRAAAAVIHKSLAEAASTVALDPRGNTPEKITKQVAGRIAAEGGRVEYVELVDAATLVPVEALAGDMLLAVAAKFGKSRLIDNINFSVKADTP